MKLKILSVFNPIFVSLAGMGAVISDATHKYIFSDTEYLKWLVVAVTVDLITGIAKVWAKDGHKAITSKGIRMTVIKFIQYGSFLIITHVLANVTVGVSKVMPFAFVKDWAYLLLLLVEIKSVYENIITIDNRLDFIKAIIERLNQVIKSKPNDKQ